MERALPSSADAQRRGSDCVALGSPRAPTTSRLPSAAPRAVARVFLSAVCNDEKSPVAGDCVEVAFVVGTLFPPFHR